MKKEELLKIFNKKAVQGMAYDDFFANYKHIFNKYGLGAVETYKALDGGSSLKEELTAKPKVEKKEKVKPKPKDK